MANSLRWFWLGKRRKAVALQPSLGHANGVGKSRKRRFWVGQTIHTNFSHANDSAEIPELSRKRRARLGKTNPTSRKRRPRPIRECERRPDRGGQALFAPPPVLTGDGRGLRRLGKRHERAVTRENGRQSCENRSSYQGSSLVGRRLRNQSHKKLLWCTEAGERSAALVP
jgi:hypothetical protein